jgi:EAL domain-containing protein (putative c-di-GMP-specific phosphodiesterase class I)
MILQIFLSLRHLRAAFDKLKIDKMFVDVYNSASQSIVRSGDRWLTILGLQVTAEGNETYDK